MLFFICSTCDVIIANKETYIDVIPTLRDVIRRKGPEKMEYSQLISPSRQCSSRQVGFGKDFLAKNEMTTLEYPPQSPHLAPADFYMLPRLKSALKVWDYCDATNIIKNATYELKRLSQNVFQECSCQKCMVAQGDYFEGSVA